MKYKLLDSTDLLVTEMLSSIENADTSVDIQFMTFESDSIANLFWDAITKKASEGVQVRCLVDSFSKLVISDNPIITPHFPRKWFELVKERFSINRKRKEFINAGGELLETNPINLLKPWKFLHHVHKKILIIDSKTAFIGGFNPSEHNYSWHDTCVRITENQTVDEIVKLFDQQFNGKFNEKSIEVPGGTIYQNNDEIMSELNLLVEKANSRIWIESAYLKDEELFKKLFDKLNQGLDVKVIKPEHNNQLIQRRLLKKMIAKYPGLFVLRKQPEPMTHAKIALIDETTIFGSSNFEYSEISEVTLFLEESSLKNQFESYFLSSFAKNK